MASQSKKFFVDKNETAGDLIQRILSAREKNIVIVVPKDATLKHSLKNFHLLKRETTAAEKNIVIESVDEEVLAFAGASEINASHPLFVEASHRMSDIVSRSPRSWVPIAKKSKQEPSGVEDEEELSGRKSAKLPEELRSLDSGDHFFRDVSSRERIRSDAPRRMRRFVGSWFGKIVLGVIIIAVAAFVVLGHFAKATILINLKHGMLSYDDAITASPQITRIAADKNQIPGEIFTNQKNFTQLFPATGKSNTSSKAKGMITIWNAYNSNPQTLVGTTRFATPDGKIFRLDKTVTVPGASVKNAQIIPSSIDTAVTADAAGESSNVGPVAKLTIPGFQGTPRYDGFYGELKTGTSGGGAGGKAVATPDDIIQAKAKAQNMLASDLQLLTIASIPDGFVIPPGASQVSISKIAVNSQTDDKGNFSVFAEATIQAIGFRASDLAALLLIHANQNSSYQQDFANLTTNYTQVSPDFAHGILTMRPGAQGDLIPLFSTSTFIGTIAGKSENEARTAISGLPGLVDAKISLWPIWETQIPKDQSRISIEVQ